MAILPNPVSPENLARRAKSAAFGFLLGRTPLSRVSLTNLDSFEKATVQFNPTNLVERVVIAKVLGGPSVLASRRCGWFRARDIRMRELVGQVDE